MSTAENDLLNVHTSLDYVLMDKIGMRVTWKFFSPHPGVCDSPCMSTEDGTLQFSLASMISCNCMGTAFFLGLRLKEGPLGEAHMHQFQDSRLPTA